MFDHKYLVVFNDDTEVWVEADDFLLGDNQMITFKGGEGPFIKMISGRAWKEITRIY